MLRLSTQQQRALLKALPMAKKAACRKHCRDMEMKGQGKFTDVMKSIGKVLGPLSKEVGPMVMKEFLLPMLKSKMGGSGLGLPGGALRLAGQGKKRRKVITKTRTKTIYR